MDQAQALSRAHRIATHPGYRLGLVQRRSANSLPRFAHLKARFGIRTAPATFDYSLDFPADSGTLYNDRWGLCAFAGHYHRLQAVVWRLTGVFLAGDALQDLALRFYEEAGGFDPSQTRPDPDNPGEFINPTDGGGDMVAVAEFLMRTGLMLPNGQRDRYTAAFSIDPRNEDDLAFCGAHCLGLGFGVDMTDLVMPADGSPPLRVWPGGGNVVGEHFVYAMARDAAGLWTVNSWGGLYKQTPDFNRDHLNTVIGYVSTDALKNGQTVMGVDAAGWLGAMRAHGYAVD